MSELTERFRLHILGPGDRPQDDGYAFVDRDPRIIDRILQYAAEEHRHTGESWVDQTPASPPTLNLVSTGGYLPAGLRVFYRWSLVDERGFESAASSVAYVDTPPPVDEPEAPALSYVPSGGFLPPGQYAYVLAAYKHATTLETKAVRPGLVTVISTTNTNTITLDLPALPAGADGFNVYRKGPGAATYCFLASTAASSYVDDGSVDLDPIRQPSTENATNGHNVVEVEVSDVPDGYSWRLYRTFYASNWNGSLLAELVEEGATPVLGLTFDDVGGASTVGAPLDVSMGVGSPPRIVLDGAMEVSGYLPSGRNIVPYQATFTQPGPVIEGEGAFTWVCEFDQADVIHVRAHLGSDRVPASQDVIVDVELQTGGTGPFDTLFTDQGDRPTVPYDQNQGWPAVPVVKHLTQGDVLRIDVDQDGGGATPTDEDLTVNILLLVQFGSTDQTWVWEDP